MGGKLSSKSGSEDGSYCNRPLHLCSQISEEYNLSALNFENLENSHSDNTCNIHISFRKITTLVLVNKAARN